MAVLSVKQGLPAPVAILAGILSGTAIGLLQGFWIAKLKVPSFVVSLAGLLGWQGALLYVLGSTGTVNLSDPLIIGIANSELPLALGWLVGLIFVGGYAFSLLNERRQRLKANLPVQPVLNSIGRIVLVGVGTLVAIGIMSVNRNPGRNVSIQGVPSAVLIFIGFIVLFDFIIRRTRFGRSVFAVGGNVEAARRAGINVDRVRVAVFMISGFNPGRYWRHPGRLTTVRRQSIVGQRRCSA